MQDLDAEVRSRAAKYFDAGYNCAQAVALSNIEIFNGRSEGIIPLLAGFGHGMNAGCVCGAISGGVAAMGSLLAGAESKGFDQTIKATTAELHRRFVDEFGVTCCRNLRKKYSLLKGARCKKITVTTAAITFALLQAQKAKSSAAGISVGTVSKPG